jgi:hypothetical protein
MLSLKRVTETLHAGQGESDDVTLHPRSTGAAPLFNRRKLTFDLVLLPSRGSDRSATL